MTQKLSEQLKAAYALIGAGKDETKWTRGNFARWTAEEPENEDVDVDCEVLSEKAVCFCSIGAIGRAIGIEPHPIYLRDEFRPLVNLISREANVSFVPVWNDKSTYAEVCAVWERAIAKAEASESCPT